MKSTITIITDVIIPGMVAAFEEVESNKASKWGTARVTRGYLRETRTITDGVFSHGTSVFTFALI